MSPQSTVAVNSEAGAVEAPTKNVPTVPSNGTPVDRFSGEAVRSVPDSRASDVTLRGEPARLK